MSNGKTKFIPTTSTSSSRFESDRHMLLEIKGQVRDQDKAKWAAAEEWVQAVNHDAHFGTWEFKVLDDPKKLFEAVK